MLNRSDLFHWLRYSFHPWGMCLVFGNVESIIYQAEGHVHKQLRKPASEFATLHVSSGIGITQAHLAMNGIETQIGFFQNDFEQKPLF